MGGLREGDRLLIHAAAGGVGIAATQIARNVGAEIFGTASPAKHDAIRAQGVQHAIDYRSQDFEAEVMRITAGEGVDLVIDALGPASFRKDYRLLRPGGRLVMFGLSEATKSGARSVPAALRSLLAMPLATMPWWKSLSMMNENKGVFGLNMLSWWEREGNLDRVTEPLLADLEAGRLEPVVAEAFPFERAGEAHEFIGRAPQRRQGRVVGIEDGVEHRRPNECADEDGIRSSSPCWWRAAAVRPRRRPTLDDPVTLVLLGGPEADTTHRAEQRRSQL